MYLRSLAPKRYDVPWRELEGEGFIAAADCTEIRRWHKPKSDRWSMRIASRRYQFRIAAENPVKLAVVQSLLKKEKGHRVLIIGEYIDQLKAIAQQIDLPLITVQKTSQPKRDQTLCRLPQRRGYRALFSRGLANFALDLPDADVLIQVSGKYGSRQEEAQRLGRILQTQARWSQRPAFLHTGFIAHLRGSLLPSTVSCFLTEQGYRYHIQQWDA